MPLKTNFLNQNINFAIKVDCNMLLPYVQKFLRSEIFTEFNFVIDKMKFSNFAEFSFTIKEFLGQQLKVF